MGQRTVNLDMDEAGVGPDFHLKVGAIHDLGGKGNGLKFSVLGTKLGLSFSLQGSHHSFLVIIWHSCLSVTSAHHHLYFKFLFNI